MDELIKRAKNGDKEAYTELIKSIQSDLYKIASTKLSNIEDVNDVIQETMLKSFKNIKKLENNELFRAWIMTILVNECNKVYIRKYRLKELIDKTIRYHSNSYEEDLNNIDNKIDFEHAISRLSSDEQIIMILYFDNKFTTGEISKILNVNINTVKSRLRRAEKKIEDYLGKGDLNNEK